MKYIFKILIISLLTYNLNAMNCSNYKDFQLFNSHYYSVSIDKLTFDSAKQIAINNGGTLAIPNNDAENDFIKSLIGGGSIGWIGIHDPNKIQNFCYGGACAYDDTRFKTVKNESLSYKNFHFQQPDNLIKEYDVVEGKVMVSPLGEHWVVMNGTNGQWLDVGNHADKYNNPVKYRAVFEFENLNECTPPIDDGVQELTGRFCNTKVWDETVDVVTMGKTLDCQMDVHGNEYCPEALAKAAEYWDYDDGYSVEGVGNVTDTTKKVQTSKYQEPIISNYCSKGSYDSITGKCIYNGLYQIVLNRQPDSGGFNHWNSKFSSPPTYYNLKSFVEAAVNLHEPYMCGSDPRKRDVKGKQIVAAYVWYLGRCPETSGFNHWYDGPGSASLFSGNTLNINHFKNSARPECESRGYCPYTPPVAYTKNSHQTNECSSTGYIYSSTSNKCESTIFSCPDGYSEANGDYCTKSISYKYYNYLCKNEINKQGENYSPVTSTSYHPKIDPNNSTINSSTLDDTLGSATPPANNCKRKGFTCNSNYRTPVFVNNEWQCSPFPCLGESNLENLDAEVGASDKNNNGWQEDGSCDGELYLFNGKASKCRSWDMFFGLTGGGCCDKEKVAAGLIACKADEKLLAAKRKAKKTHYIGNFCSKKIRLGFAKICIQKSDGYCTFNSTLGRIIQEQGREQLEIEWGSASNPECRGFTPDEFQKVDFSKIDLTEFVKDIQSTVNTNVIQNLGTYVKDKVGGFYEGN